MVNLVATSVQIGERTWGQTKATYPARPTVYSGVSISFGADSCFDHPEPTKASLDLWTPKLYSDWLPTIGEIVTVAAAFDTSPGTQVFAGKVDSVLLEDDHKTETAPYVPLNVAGSWRNVTKTTWKVFNSQSTDITASTTVVGNNTFRVPVSGANGQVIRVISPQQAIVAGMDYQFTIDNFPGATIYSVVTADLISNLGVVVSSKQYPLARTGTVQIPSGTLTNTTLRLTFSYTLSLDSGLNGSVNIGDIKLLKLFADKAAGSDYPGYRIRINCSDALAEAGRLRIGDQPWPKENGLARMTKIARAGIVRGVGFEDRATILPGYNEVLYAQVKPRDVDSINALEVYQNTAMTGGLTVSSVDNVVTTSAVLKLPKVLSLNANGVATVTEIAGIPTIPTDAIEDSTFELDATQTVNQLKIEHFAQVGNEIEDAATLIGAPSNYAPVQRTVTSEGLVTSDRPDAFNGLKVRADAALAAQLSPRWRLGNGMTLVLAALDTHSTLTNLIDESARFGQLVKVSNTPSFVGEYQRVRGGRIVLGENPLVEFDLEPVDYSGPAPISRSSAFNDSITRPMKISALQNSGLTINDFRAIGSR